MARRGGDSGWSNAVGTQGSKVVLERADQELSAFSIAFSEYFASLNYYSLNEVKE